MPTTMTDRRSRRLSEEEARELWERAARLQAEAATRALPAPVEGEDELEVDDAGLSLDVVRNAALEAGIDPSFVDDALVELDESGPVKPVDLAADRFLGEDTPVARVTRTLSGSVDEVYLALQRVLPRNPFGLVLKRVDGPDPRKGGALVFEVPYSVAAANGLQMSGPAIDIRHYADLKELRVRLRELAPDDAGQLRTEVEVTASRTHARRVNYWVGLTMSGMAALVGALPVSLITAGLLSLTGPAEALAVLGVGGTASVGGWLGARAGWRKAYHWGQKKGEGGIERMLDAIDLDLRTGGAFSTGTQPQELGDGGDDLSGLGGIGGLFG